MRDFGGEIERPDAVSPTILKREAAQTNIELHKWLDDRKNRRALPHKLERVGYSVVRNLEAEDGLWLVAGKREAVYVRADIKGVEERLGAVRRLQEDEQAAGRCPCGQATAGGSVISVTSVNGLLLPPCLLLSSFSFLGKHE